MKTRLLKKIRKLHPIYFDSNTKKYQYKTVFGKKCMGSFKFDFESKWVEDYRILLDKRSELILKDANSYFSESWFCYKRKREREKAIKRIF